MGGATKKNEKGSYAHYSVDRRFSLIWGMMIMEKRNRTVKEVIEAGSIEELASIRHSLNINEVHDSNLTVGGRIADKLADFAGSWTFIIAFLLILLSWITLNSVFVRHFDPFPFILLNLVLSSLAAIQAPVIMMSQNRQETKDRIRAEHDYEVNLKTEIIVAEVLNKLNELDKNQHEMMKHLNGNNKANVKKRE